MNSLLRSRSERLLSRENRPTIETDYFFCFWLISWQDTFTFVLSNVKPFIYIIVIIFTHMTNLRSSVFFLGRVRSRRKGREAT